MFTRILSPLSAEPNLALARAYVRRTPLARLSIVYQIQPQYNGAVAGSAPRLPQNNAIAYSELLNKSWAHAQLQLSRNLGQELYMDSIIMGGIDGETLPVTLDPSVQAEIASHMPGGLLDVNA
jgi:hypothetical protein